VLTFDEASHTYFWNGKRVPNVTSIIAHLTDYSHIPADRLRELQERGKAIHKMVALAIRDDLAELPEWLRPYHQAWRSFVAFARFEPWESEQRVYHHRMGYAGTLDLAGTIHKGGGVLIDIKRSLYAGPAIGLQLAAYEMARNETVERCRRTSSRWALELHEDGKYNLTPYEDEDDRIAFIACLQQYRWRQRHYPTPKEQAG
jgi:hypothetical protein